MKQLNKTQTQRNLRLISSAYNRTGLSRRAKDPIAQLDRVHDLVKDVAVDVAEGISTVMSANV